jgi:hypothetical protein
MGKRKPGVMTWRARVNAVGKGSTAWTIKSGLVMKVWPTYPRRQVTLTFEPVATISPGVGD